MAKRKSGINKSEAVREYLKANPEAKPKAAAEAVSKQTGVSVTPAFVSQIKTLDKKKSGKTGGGMSSGGKGRKAASFNTAEMDTLAVIEAAKRLIAGAGGVEGAKRILDALAG